MAKTVQERSAKAAQKRMAVAEKELRHKVRPGIEQAMERICARGKMPSISEALQIVIMGTDLMGCQGWVEFLRNPRHEIVISERRSAGISLKNISGPKTGCIKWHNQL